MKQEEIDRIVAAIHSRVYLTPSDVEYIKELLASLDQTGIDLREVEKLVQEFIRTENSLRELRWVTTLGVETTAEAYRKAIGYTLNDLEQFKNDEG